MRSQHRILALLTLLGWLFAIGHVALEHGGVAADRLHHALAAGGEDDDHDDHDGQHHHHDFTAMNGGASLKVTERQALAPVWAPLCDALVKRLTAMLREAGEPRRLAGLEHSPPDERAGGWLLVCRTAQPIRGPSLAI